MYLLDNFIRDKYLEDILVFFRQYEIEGSIDPLGAIDRNLIFGDNSRRDNFREDIYKIYIKHYQRNFAILEALAIKQDLDTERRVLV